LHFQADTSKSTPSSDDKETAATKSTASTGKPSISVKKELLTNAKA